MSAITDRANDTWRDSETYGLPASGEHDPVKAEVRADFAALDAVISTLGVAAGGAISVSYATRAALYADLDHAANTLAIVWGDSTSAYNGIYAKAGASGAGSWAITDIALPATFADTIAAVLAQLENVDGIAAAAAALVSDAAVALINALAASIVADGGPIDLREADAIVAIDAEAAAQTANLMQVALMTGGYAAITYASTAGGGSNVLPQGVTALSAVGVGTGSGGTPGVNIAGGVSGGPTGFAWTYDIGSDGKIAAYRVTNTGRASTTTAPTLSYPTGGVTGATVPVATVSTTIPVGGYYCTPTADSAYLALWTNSGTGVPVAVTGPDGNQIKQILSAKIAEYIDALDWTQRIGLATVGDGTGTVSAGTYGFGTPIERSGSKFTLPYFGAGVGTAYVQIQSQVGTTRTVVAEQAFTTATGAQTATFNLPYTAGQFVGIRCPGGLIDISSGSGTGFGGYYAAAGVQKTVGDTFTASSLNNADFKMAFDFSAPGLTAAEFQALSDLIGGTDVAALAAYVGEDSPALDTYFLPVATTPTTGGPVGTATYLLNKPAPFDQVLTRIRSDILTPGTVNLRAFSGSTGSGWTPTGTPAAAVLAGSGAISTTDVPKFILPAGCRLGIQTSAGVFPAVAASGGNQHPYFTGPADGSAFTDATTTDTIVFMFGADFEPVSLASRVRSLEAATGGSSATLGVPGSFFLHLALGESHRAGRSTVLSTYEVPVGSGYCYRRATTSLGQLVDPTGNEGISRGTFGPAHGYSMLEATGGTVGVILVNSGVGSAVIGADAGGSPGWATGGSAWTQAVTDYAGALAAIKAAKLSVSGCVASLDLGSNDAAAGTSKATFKAAVLDLLARLKTLTGDANLKLILTQTGTNSTGDTTAYQTIRQAQTELVEENADILMGWSGAKWLAGSGEMIDSVHRAQTANDREGRSITPVALVAGAGRYPTGLEGAV